MKNVIADGFGAMNESVLFSTSSTDAGEMRTVKLLQIMFNGTNASKQRDLMEKRFYNRFKMEYNHFQPAVHDYLSGKTDKMRLVISQLLSEKSNYLAFKYTIIMQNETLKRDFGERVR